METQILKLSSPLQTHKGLIEELEIKEPKARSFSKHGSPFHIRTLPGGGTDIQFDDKAMLGFLADCTEHDAIVLGNLSAQNFMEARTTLFRMIVGAIGSESPTTPSEG